MYATPRKPKIKDETPHGSKKSTDEKIKRSLSNLTTPRTYQQKTTNDIYGAKKTLNISTPKAPKKIRTTDKTLNASPMQNQLKSSSTTSIISTKAVSTLNGQRNISKTADTKAQKLKNEVIKKDVAKTNKQLFSNEVTKPNKLSSTRDRTSKEIVKEKSKKNVLTTNVTVNSPVVKKKTYNSVENAKEYSNDNVERQRTKTRTLDESEAKILTVEAVDNNAEMQNLTRKLNARPKAFFVDLKDDQNKLKNEKVSEDEYSYEDDFESYESDFDSYHSEKSSNSDKNSSEDPRSDKDDGDDKLVSVVDNSLKESKDEEKMLDSGNFDLRDPQRSAQKSKPMDFIVELSEESSDKKTSLTDEGFQDMSSSSATSSMRTTHVDVLERPLLLDFTKSNKSNRTKQSAVRRKQRAKELLEMITLHTMSYSLFELNPIPYNIYIATYGRANYKQTEIQTNDDYITEEIQTENVETENKWTQHPVKFSKNTIISQKRKSNNDKAIENFTFLTNSNEDTVANNESDDYKSNPLRIYLEQNNGVGKDGIMAYEKYKSKLDNEIDMKQLKRFVKAVESRIVKALSTTTNYNEAIDTNQKSNYPFSDTYTTVSPKDINFKDFKQYKIVDVYFSDSKSNLAMIVHKKRSTEIEKSIICLWDVSAKLEKPLKFLVAVDELSLGKFRGGADGIFAAALKDGSIHLWDLSEKPTFTDEDSTAELHEVKKSGPITQVEIDREWNLTNSHVGYHDKPVTKQCLHSSVYTSSANSIYSKEISDTITGLEVIHERRNMDSGRKILGQICSLLRIGIITIWSIVQEKKSNNQVLGKAYWSKTKLEKSTQINLTDYIDKPISDDTPNKAFSLNAAKRRIIRRKSEKSLLNEFSRPKSDVSLDVDIDRPASTASRKNRNSNQIENKNSWDSGLVCKDLKVMKINVIYNYLIAKNCGEVISLRRSMGAAKVERLEVASNGASVSKLEVSPHGLPYFLAATDCGTLNLCSLLESRVLLTLDCRNGPPSSTSPLTPDVEKYNTDSRGRFIGTVPLKRQTSQPVTLEFQTALKSLHWLPTNPCSIVTLSQDGVVSLWQLECSDICPSFTKQTQAVVSSVALENLAFVTKAGDVEVHKLINNKNLTDNLSLFQKYVSLL